MDTILKVFNDFCLTYTDDILVFSNKYLDDHFKKVELVLNKCFEHEVVLSKKKVVIAKNKINYLGLEIEKGKIIMQKHALEKHQNFPTKLKDKMELQRFLGLLTYISNEGFIKNLAAERKLLQQKLKKDSIWSWTEEDEVLITKLKYLCQDLPELYHPSNDDLIIIETDASNEYWGGVLKAKSHGQKKELLCRYICLELFQTVKLIILLTKKKH